jgi:glycosyltransferase involved in cell wall biosynthesis
VKVSAAITAYNHERFIGQAIEGFLIQKTDFPCELVIVEDCSTDGTRDVIRRYWEKSPNRIRVLLNRHNLGGFRTLVRACNACCGQYVAPMDGDDYWVSPNKLQRQADLLDSREDCAMCFHPVSMVWEDGSQESTVLRPPAVRDTYTLADLLESNFIGACSPMYRRGLVCEYPAWFFLTPVADWPHHILHAWHGDIGYIDEPMGVYRQHPDGVYSAKDRAAKLRIAVDVLRRLCCVVPREHRIKARQSLCTAYCRLIWEYCDRGREDEARRCMSECIREVRPGLSFPVRELLATALRAHAPGLHRRLKRTLKGSDRSTA